MTSKKSWFNLYIIYFDKMFGSKVVAKKRQNFDHFMNFFSQFSSLWQECPLQFNFASNHVPSLPKKNFIFDHYLMLCYTSTKLENRLKVRFWSGILPNWHSAKILNKKHEWLFIQIYENPPKNENNMRIINFLKKNQLRYFLNKN